MKLCMGLIMDLFSFFSFFSFLSFLTGGGLGWIVLFTIFPFWFLFFRCVFLSFIFIFYTFLWGYYKIRPRVSFKK